MYSISVQSHSTSVQSQSTSIQSHALNVLFKLSRDTKGVLKWALVRIAAFRCASRYHIWIPEIEYYQIVSSHAQIRPQGAEKQQSKMYSL